MMTSKQKWFIGKLMKEIEEMTGYEFIGVETYYGGNEYDSYRTSKKEASKDIEMLLAVKEKISNGMTFDEARIEYIDETN